MIADMPRNQSEDGRLEPTRHRSFTTTHWSVVLAARDTDSPEADAALAELCRTYWYPLYAFVRRKGHSPHDAQDLTQAFFARLLEKNYVAQADRERGRFRTYLLAALTHFLSDEWDKARRLKRGGGREFISFDAAEERYRLEPIEALRAATARFRTSRRGFDSTERRRGRRLSSHNKAPNAPPTRSRFTHPGNFLPLMASSCSPFVGWTEKRIRKTAKNFKRGGGKNFRRHSGAREARARNP